MGSKTHPSIKKEVIRLWLKGLPRDQIANEVDIGARTVSSIVKECRPNDPDFDLLREVAVIIKNEGMNLNLAASSIRLKRILEDNGLNEEQIESFIEKIEIHCFKRSLDVNEFINLIFKISIISNNLDVSIDNLPEYVLQKKEELYGIIEKVSDLESEKDDLLKEKEVTMDILSDYEKKRPVAEKLAETERELGVITKERDSSENEITAKSHELHKMKYEQMIPTEQVDIVNKRLDVHTVPKELDDLMKEFRQHVGIYPDVIKIMRDRRRYTPFDINKYI
ncbi:MAG TPA: hypothetical protein VH481_04890 [Nitrososphaeraceae archaeon]